MFGMPDIQSVVPNRVLKSKVPLVPPLAWLSAEPGEVAAVPVAVDCVAGDGLTTVGGGAGGFGFGVAGGADA